MKNITPCKTKENGKKIYYQEGRCLFKEKSISIFQNNQEYKFKIKRR